MAYYSGRFLISAKDFNAHTSVVRKNSYSEYIQNINSEYILSMNLSFHIHKYSEYEYEFKYSEYILNFF